jgi:hypothetical protein
LLIAKKGEVEYEKNVFDKRERMKSAIFKWNLIAEVVMRESKSRNVWNREACENKWNSLIHDFRKISDYQARIGHNISYFQLNPKEKEKAKLPKSFYEPHYDFMASFLNERPSFNPPHARDWSLDKDTEYD